MSMFLRRFLERTYNAVLDIKQPVATDWVTTTDISGTGESVVESANLDIAYHTIAEAILNPVVEVQFTQSAPVGDGRCRAWLRIRNTTLNYTTTSNSNGVDYYTQRLERVGSVPITRRIFIQIPVLSCVGGVNVSDLFRLLVRANADTAETQWSVTDIKARLIYTPL
jgi:hypothetical protein